MSFLELAYNVTWPTFAGCAGGLALATFIVWLEKYYNRFRVRREELRWYKARSR